MVLMAYTLKDRFSYHVADFDLVCFYFFFYLKLLLYDE